MTKHPSTRLQSCGPCTSRQRPSRAKRQQKTRPIQGQPRSRPRQALRSPGQPRPPPPQRRRARPQRRRLPRGLGADSAPRHPEPPQASTSERRRRLSQRHTVPGQAPPLRPRIPRRRPPAARAARAWRRRPARPSFPRPPRWRRPRPRARGVPGRVQALPPPQSKGRKPLRRRSALAARRPPGPRPRRASRRPRPRPRASSRRARHNRRLPSACPLHRPRPTCLRLRRLQRSRRDREPSLNRQRRNTRPWRPPKVIRPPHSPQRRPAHRRRLARRLRTRVPCPCRASLISHWIIRAAAVPEPRGRARCSSLPRETLGPALPGTGLGLFELGEAPGFSGADVEGPFVSAGRRYLAGGVACGSCFHFAGKQGQSREGEAGNARCQ
mmetsp:Transcript_63030/g.195151  ORF Transcript_63030/g.195151 Transcript_63030/m.195151 type:complete len:383 (+) Transcript_63030:512-1660(+)